ncbi:hypothetical protein C1645_833140 [Glomus cerebriforme]|uniref:Uncharacterized protein n=1 Tax=Glomus cerebriforme TaxID=658196 RepID=A0A397SED0_9GLOM|nr:hypothetical protein C1645_833140 [Glomus cerebriforme]
MDFIRPVEKREMGEAIAYEFLPKIGKPLLPSSLRNLGAMFAVVTYYTKNLSKVGTISDEAFRHSLDNHASLSKRYTILKRKVNLLEAELDDLNEYINRKTVVDLIQELALSPNNKKLPKKGEVNLATVDFYESSSSEESESDVANLEWSKRKTLFDFCTISLVQGENTVKDFYSKLEECNKSFSHSEEFLKCALLKGLSPKNKIKVLIGGLQVLALDEILEKLKHKEAVDQLISLNPNIHVKNFMDSVDIQAMMELAFHIANNQNSVLPQ